MQSTFSMSHLDSSQKPTTLQDDITKQPDYAAEAFIIHTDQIYYFAILYTDENWYAYGNGYAQFADGQKMSFAMDSNSDPKVREKCIQASRQIARVYQGTLHQGIIDGSGRFWPEKDGNTAHNLM